MSTLIDIPITKIVPHPKNVRRDAIADQELIDSVTEQGILQPIGVVTHGAKYLLIAGHRRLAAAKGAKLKTVPAIVHDHLVTEAQQIEAMLVENGRRQDLTAMEEADAYEQLELLGVDAAAIAKTTGRSTKTVKSRLTLVKLPTAARDALHSHQITIGQAEHLVDLEDHPDLLARAVKAMGTGNFEYELRSTLQRAKALETEAALREEYSKMSLPEIKKPKSGWDYTNGPYPLSQYSEEQLKQADAWWAGDTRKNSYDSAPRLILTKVEGGATGEDLAKAAAKREREDARRKKDDQARHLATQMRAEHVVSITAGLTLPESLRPHIQAATARIVADLDASTIEVVIAAAGVDGLKRQKNDYSNVVLASQILKLNLGQLLAVLGAAIAVKSAGNLHSAYGDRDVYATANAHAYWAAFDTSGYDLPAPDKKTRAGLKPVADAA